MNANAKKWVQALRSREFRQTAGTLRDEDGYCCLGVACVLAERETGVGFKDNDILPYRVAKWLGLCSRDGSMTGFASLAETNDNGATFQQIADLIEAEPAGLFVDGKSG